MILKLVRVRMIPNSEAHKYELNPEASFLARLGWSLIDLTDERNEGYLDYCIRKRIVVLRKDLEVNNEES